MSDDTYKQPKIRSVQVEEEDLVEATLEEKINLMVEEFGPSGEITAKIFRKAVGSNYEQICVIEDIGPENRLDTDEIGKTYGGGRYRAYFQLNNKLIRTLRFTLGKEYDKYLATPPEPQRHAEGPRLTELVESVRSLQAMSAKQAETPAAPPGKAMDWEKVIAIAGPAMAALATVFKTIVDPIAEAIRDNNRAKPQDDTLKMLLPLLIEQTKFKNDTAMTSFKEGMTLAREALVPAVQGKEPVDWQDIVMEMVKQAPLVLTPMFQSFGMRGLIARYPQAKTVFDNPEAFAAFKKQLAEEHGEEQAQKILSVVGMNPAATPAPVSGGVRLP